MSSREERRRPDLPRRSTLPNAARFLLVSKLDRLAATSSHRRNHEAREHQGRDNAHADPFQMHLFAALAEKERKFIGERTKAALARQRQGRQTGGYCEAAWTSGSLPKETADDDARRIQGIVEPSDSASRCDRSQPN